MQFYASWLHEQETLNNKLKKTIFLTELQDVSADSIVNNNNI